MPIKRLLSDVTLTPEQHRVLELAFAKTLRKLGLVDRDDPVCELIAQRLLDVHKRGVADAMALTEITIREFGLPQR